MRISDWSSDVCSSDLFARGATRTGVDAAFRIKAAATGDAADGITADPAKTAAKRTAQRSAERAAKAAIAAQKLSRGRSCCQGNGRRRRGDQCLFHLSTDRKSVVWGKRV